MLIHPKTNYTAVQGTLCGARIASIQTAKRSKTTNEFFLIWTTTPWTLPSNLAVAVHPELKSLS